MHDVQKLWELVSNLKENRTMVLFDHTTVQAQCAGICWWGKTQEFFDALREANKEPGTLLKGHSIGPYELRTLKLYAPMPDGSVAEIPPGDESEGERDERYQATQEVRLAWHNNIKQENLLMWRCKTRALWAARKLAGLPCKEPRIVHSSDGEGFTIQEVSIHSSIVPT